MKTIINPGYEHLREFILNLPQRFNDLGEIVYQGRNQIRIIDIDGIRLNVKSFKVPNIINRIVYGNFRESKAKRSFDYANILLQNGINTPIPVAYMEEKTFLLFKRSYYISLHEDFDGMMRELKWGKIDGREPMLKQFAEFTASMHNKGILHLDYSPGNILYKKKDESYSFYLVDLNRMYFGDVSEDTGCKNFCRLWGNEDMLSYIAKEYAKARDFDEKKCIGLVLRYHREFWYKFTQKYKDKSPYIG